VKKTVSGKYVQQKILDCRKFFEVWTSICLFIVHKKCWLVQWSGNFVL